MFPITFFDLLFIYWFSLIIIIIIIKYFIGLAVTILLRILHVKVIMNRKISLFVFFRNELFSYYFSVFYIIEIKQI